MNRSLTVSVALVIAVAFLLTLIAGPLSVRAFSDPANAMCKPATVVDYSRPWPTPAQPPQHPLPGGLNAHCYETVSGTVINGFCIQPNKCNGNPMQPDVNGNMTQLGKTAGTGESTSILGQVGDFMQKNPLVTGMLLQSVLGGLGGSGSGSSGVSSNPYGTTAPGICTSQQYYTTNPSTNDPCAIYSPTGTGPGTSLPTGPAPDTSLDSLLGGLNTGSGTSSDGGGSSGGLCPLANTLISCSQGTVPSSPGPDANGCPLPPVCVSAQTGTISSSSVAVNANGVPCGSGACADGYYCSNVAPGKCIPNNNVDCGAFSCQQGYSCGQNNQCLPAGGGLPVAGIFSKDFYSDKTSSSTPSQSQTPLAKKEVPLPGQGLQGDLLSAGGGVTIYAQNLSDNVIVSGFYGSNSTSGGMCQDRPWAHGFLSYIIPPSFFDGICSLAGFKPSPQPLLTGSGGGHVQVVSGPKMNGTPATPAESADAPEAKIAASPASVNIGGRTTVFWTSRNVSSCEESSSDGNFHGTSVSGGASTQPLSGPVTYTIKCLGRNAAWVTSSVTVNIGL